MSKYAPLKIFLFSKKGSKTLKLSFKNVEDIIKDKLPYSAYNKNLRQWWQNSYSPRRKHVQAVAWHTAGWKVSNVDYSLQSVTFVEE
jgi:hypothetical protein